LIYRLPKPARDGRTFIQLEPLEFIERIAAFIPYPRRHRRHYHGVFAPSSSLREKVAANAQKTLLKAPQEVKETAKKIKKISFTWAKLIARIYEANPLLCTSCGKEVRIIAFVTHSAQIWRILKGIGLPTDIPEFDSEHEVHHDICQLLPGAEDGFPEEISHLVLREIGPDPPWQDYADPPHTGCSSDPPFWED